MGAGHMIYGELSHEENHMISEGCPMTITLNISRPTDIVGRQCEHLATSRVIVISLGQMTRHDWIQRVQPFSGADI